MILFRAPQKMLKAVSLLMMKTRKGKGEELAGVEIKILLARRQISKICSHKIADKRHQTIANYQTQIMNLTFVFSMICSNMSTSSLLALASSNNSGPRPTVGSLHSHCNLVADTSILTATTTVVLTSAPTSAPTFPQAASAWYIPDYIEIKGDGFCLDADGKFYDAVGFG
jgi:hypothetical protein